MHAAVIKILRNKIPQADIIPQPCTGTVQFRFHFSELFLLIHSPPVPRPPCPRSGLPTKKVKRVIQGEAPGDLVLEEDLKIGGGGLPVGQEGIGAGLDGLEGRRGKVRLNVVEGGGRLRPSPLIFFFFFA